jgi:2-polyprenyl-6-methoxyphenol hydroxylase-like FAD-dependent oxidoreductase
MDGRIVIVGGGIAGLCLRLALDDRRWDVDLVERNSAAEPLGAGLAVQPNAMRVLRRLGVAAAVERAGTVISRFQYRDRSGAMLCDVDLPALWADVGPFVGITRSALHEVLRCGVDRCRAGTAVTSVSERDGRMWVAFDDHRTEGPYDLVVGADGIGSVVRRFVAGPAEPVYGGQMVWRSLAEFPDRCGPEAVQFFLGDDRFFGLCPAGDQHLYGFGTRATPRRDDPVELRRRRLREAFGGFAPPVTGYLSRITSDAVIHCGPIEWYADVAWRRGRAVLAGDAAHAMSPMMGQGACLAIEDAFVLAEELGRQADIETALAAYAQRRRPRVTWVRAQSETLGNLLRQHERVRNAALREAGTTAFHRRYGPLVAPM